MENNNLLELSLEWFFGKSDSEKIELKEKYFPNELIEYSEQWGFHFTFGHIEKMFKYENNIK